MLNSIDVLFGITWKLEVFYVFTQNEESQADFMICFTTSL